MRWHTRMEGYHVFGRQWGRTETTLTTTLRLRWHFAPRVQLSVGPSLRDWRWGWVGHIDLPFAAAYMHVEISPLWGRYAEERKARIRERARHGISGVVEGGQSKGVSR